MNDIRPIALVIGILLTTLGGAMVIPALLDLVTGEPNWIHFTVSAILTLFVGVGLVLAAWGYATVLTVKQAFLLTVGTWIALTGFAALPFALAENITYTDAFFEAMSGLTTTGATVMTELESKPLGVLLWRALLQWMGGIGIIVMAIAVLPMLQIGGMQLFRMESSDTSEKILPRATQIAGSISLLYLVLTLACTVGYYFAGMSMFDAATHSMTTIATGGFANYDASIGHFQSGAIDAIGTVFMLLGSLPFVLYLQAIRGNAMPLVTDSQVRFFLTVVAAAILITWIVHLGDEREGPLRALQHTAFNVVSVITGTGYATTDYGSWGNFAVAFFFCIMFMGGCAGSTSCGIKTFRFQVILENMRIYLQRIIYPSGVFSPRYNNRPLSEGVISAVSSFFFLFLLCFGLLALSLNLIGLDNLTSLSAAASAMANVGPGLGEVVGPAGNYSTLPDSAKWLLCFGMLLGRLELFTVLVLFTPAFWKA